MLTETRVNFKRYFLITGLSTGMCLLFARHIDDVLGILIVYVAALINQILLVKVVRQVFRSESSEGNNQDSKFRVTKNFFGKMAILAVGLTLGVHLMGNRIIIPVLNYVIQIFALAFSLKPTEELENMPENAKDI